MIFDKPNCGKCLTIIILGKKKKLNKILTDLLSKLWTGDFSSELQAKIEWIHQQV